MSEQNIGEKWAGVNRRIAPHLLPPSQSPDCYDCAPSADVEGVLGARLGRSKQYNRTYNIEGMGVFSFPDGSRGRVFMDANGNWSVVAITFPSLSTVAVPNGWRRVSISGLTASQTGVGTNTGTSKALATAQDMSTYGLMAYSMPEAELAYGDVLIADASNNSTSGYITLQGKIGGSWVDLVRLYVDQTGFIYKTTILRTNPGSGSLTDVRMQATVTAGVGTIAAQCEFDIFLQYGSELEVIATA